MTHKLSISSVLALSSVLFACGAEEEAASQEDDATSARTQYVDIGQFVKDADYEAWSAARRGLEQGFDNICGDTFCGGDWSNLYSLGFTCSVSSKVGKVRECLWTFAGSQEQVDGQTGAISSSIGFFECRMKPTGNASALVNAFGADPLHAQLPGLQGEVYDQLYDCFENAIGAQPLPEYTEGTYADVLDVVQGDVYEQFFTATHNAHQAFDDVCGDTFCEGEYTNLQSLRLRCSQNDQGALGECLWTIAGSDTRIDSRGWLKSTGAPFSCKIPVSGTAADLAAALSPEDNGTPLFERKLPGSNESLNDALGRCL